nr:type I inositol polyphosphate 5-phosphatase 5-like [Ipomoea trifida]
MFNKPSLKLLKSNLKANSALVKACNYHLDSPSRLRKLSDNTSSGSSPRSAANNNSRDSGNGIVDLLSGEEVTHFDGRSAYMVGEFAGIFPLNMFSTRLMEIRLVLHPIPDKLNALTSSLIGKCRTIFEHNNGTDDNVETFTMRTSISARDTSDFTNNSSNVSKKHSSISSI